MMGKIEVSMIARVRAGARVWGVSQDSTTARAYRNREASRHSVQVVRVVAHVRDLRDDGPVGPLDAEDLGKLLQVLGGRLADAKDGVAEPAHAEGRELIVEELDAELAREEGDVFDDGQTHPPVLVFCELDDRREETL
jgi:hypothetical protein